MFALQTGRVLLVCSILLAGTSVATTAALDKLDHKQFCPGGGAGPVSKYLLARSIVKLYKVPVDIIDWDDTGVTYDQYARVLTVPLCARPSTAAQVAKCKGADGESQWQMVQEVAEKLNSAGADKGDFDIKLPNNMALRFHRKNTPSSLDIQKQPILGLGNISIAAQTFLSTDPATEFFNVSCVSVAPLHPAPPARPVGTTPPIPADSVKNDVGWPPPADPQASILNLFRVRAKPEDLAISRDIETFAGVSPASLAIVNDNIARKNTFDLHLTVGYVLPAWPLGTEGAVINSIPFVRYDRDFVDGSKAPPSSSNVNNISVGLVESFTFPLGGVFFSNISAQPQFVHSLRNGADIAKLRASYQPQPLMPLLGSPLSLGVPDFYATAYVRAVLNTGHLSNSVNDPTLARMNNFAQAGYQVGGAIFDNKEGSSLNGLSISSDYTSLKGFSGQYKSINWFQAAVNYTFPKTKYVTLGLSYTNGRNLDTFELQKLYKASIGLKY